MTKVTTNVSDDDYSKKDNKQSTTKISSSLNADSITTATKKSSLSLTTEEEESTSSSSSSFLSSSSANASKSSSSNSLNNLSPIQNIDGADDVATNLTDTIGVREEFISKAKDFEALMEEVSKMIVDYYYECGRPTETTIFNKDYGMLTPNDIFHELGGAFSSDAETTFPASTNEELLQTIRLCFKHSIKSMHPFFLDKLYFGTDPIGQISELIVAVLNANTHVYHVSPVLSSMEIDIIHTFGNVYFGSAEKTEGTLNPGGSMSNMMALLLARNEKFPHVRTEGWKTTDKPVAFTAIQSHYSIQKAAMVCGMGSNQLKQIPSGGGGRPMDVFALEESIQNEIQKGNTPFFVNAVAGSTVLGTFDDISSILKVCKKYGNIWLHVDACWGGFLIFCSSDQKRKELFDGINDVNSVSFNPHKGLGIPQQCSMLLVNNNTTNKVNNDTTYDTNSVMQRSNGTKAEYLFHSPNINDNNNNVTTKKNNKINEVTSSIYDIGDKTLGCGRKGDALKIWLTMKKLGYPTGFAKIADNELRKAHYLRALIQESNDFELVLSPTNNTTTTAINVCFWYIPTYYSSSEENEYSYDAKCHVHKTIFERMKGRSSHCIIQQQPLSELNLPNFFRIALGADKTRYDDMKVLLQEIRNLGHDIIYYNSS